MAEIYKCCGKFVEVERINKKYVFQIHVKSYEYKIIITSYPLLHLEKKFQALIQSSFDDKFSFENA